MCSEIVARASNLGKCYQIYQNPRDRLKQGLFRGRKYYREFWALSGVNFEIRRGETIGIVGRNGSGKSTLLQLLCGTLTPSCGEVEIKGRVAALLELGAGFNPEFTGRENVYLNASILGLSREQTEARFQSILEFAEIGEFIDQPVKTYSSGMYVRLAFAVIANVDADILVIDEALAVGDVFFTQKCMRFLRRFTETGTIIFVSHDTGAVLNLCQRAIWLSNGKLRAAGSAKEVTELYLEDMLEPAAPEIPKADPEPQRQPDEPGDAREFGARGAVIKSATLVDGQGKPLLVATDETAVELCFEVEALAEICPPLAGFIIKDRFGQILFARDTTTASGLPKIMSPGTRARARFNFILPQLAPGDYTVSVAIGEGTRESPLIHHWIHDAIAFKSGAAGVLGMIGLPGAASSFEVL